MLIRTVSSFIAANSIEHVQVPNLPRQKQERCQLGENASCLHAQGFNCGHTEECKTKLKEILHSTGNSWTQVRANHQYKAMDVVNSEGHEKLAPCRRLRDFLETTISCLLPQSGEMKLTSDVSCDKALAKHRPSGVQDKKPTSPWHHSNIIFTTDFDVTCTVEDTCEILVRTAELAASKRTAIKDLETPWHPRIIQREYEAAINRHAERTRMAIQTLESQEGECDTSTCSPRRGRLMVSGSQDQREITPSVRPFNEKIRESIVSAAERGGPFKEAELRMVLTNLAILEIMCNQDVMAAGVLSGPTREEIRAAAARVRLRPNCPEVLQRLADSGTAVHIVSANWSRDLIFGGLPKLPDGKLFIHSTDLLYDSAGMSLGIMNGRVVDAFDKEEVLITLRSMYRTTMRYNLQRSVSAFQSLVANTQLEIDEERGNGAKMLVYLGDSHTDLLGLIEADLGIVIGANILMRRIMALYNIQILPLDEASARISAARLYNSGWSYRMSGVLFEAQSWVEVETCLFGGSAGIQS